MFFRQVLHEDLGCASYVIGGDGHAAVVDPRWDIDAYLEIATAHDLRIEHILETHNHADHLSGRGRLAGATGARILICGDAGAEYGHDALADGEVVEVGDARITALAMPGHRPEHLGFLVGEAGGEPWALLSGDSLFVGDVARPDLAVDPEEGAHRLFGSLRRLDALADGVELWPGHVGGSLCGGSGMSEKPSSTLGHERRTNRYLAMDEAEFVRELTEADQPQPPNFERVVELNRGPLLSEAAALAPVAPREAARLSRAGATILDAREPREFDGSHVPGSLNVTIAKPGVGTRAAWMVDPDAEVIVLAGGDAEAVAVARLLEAVGFRNLRGYVAGGMPAWRSAGLEVATIPALDVAGLAARLAAGEARLLDVREADEYERAHVPGSLHVPYHDLRGEVPAEVADADGPLAVACSAGNRSAVAASALVARGVQRIEHVADGGVADLADHGIALRRGGGGSGGP